MFHTAELGRTLDEISYEAAVPALRAELLKSQSALGRADFPVIVLLHGDDILGAGEVLNLLHEWLDTRYLDTQAWERSTDEERDRPEYWRYWQWLPAKRRIGIFLGSWYTKPLSARTRGKLSEAEYDEELARAAAFEKTLTDDGTLIVKLWLHVTKDEQQRKLDALVASPTTRHRVSKRDLRHLTHYEELLRAGSQAIAATSTTDAPWTLVETTDRRYRNVTIAEKLVSTLQKHLASRAPHRSVTRGAPTSSVAAAAPVPALSKLDLTKKLEYDEYRERLATAEAELAGLAKKLDKRQESAILVFEGWDASGKGGSIRRVTMTLDARQYRVIPISAPSEEELAHHYLWRFWRRIPRRGRFTIYDRSWYGRVLVERVEGFASEDEWSRAYQEINAFEAELVRANGVVAKFWLHIGKEEQLRRFEARKREPWKQYKLTDEDYRNRAKSAEYEVAADEMIARTDTEHAPWTLIEAEDKRFGRVKVLETLCERLKRRT